MTAGATMSVSQRVFASQWARVTLAVGFALTGFVATVVVVRSDRLERKKFEEQAANVAARIEGNFVAPLEAVFAVDAFTKAAPNEDLASFSKFAKPLLERHPSLAALEWAEFVTDPERAAYELAVSRHNGAPWWIREPGATGAFVPAAKRADYTVLRRLEPYSTTLDGLDVAFEPQRRKFLEMARGRNGMVVTSKFRLVEDAEGVYSVAV